MEAEQVLPVLSQAETNRIQIELIAESGLNPIEWICHNSQRFREVIESCPELAEMHRQNPHACMDFVKQKLKIEKE